MREKRDDKPRGQPGMILKMSDIKKVAPCRTSAIGFGLVFSEASLQVKTDVRGRKSTLRHAGEHHHYGLVARQGSGQMMAATAERVRRNTLKRHLMKLQHDAEDAALVLPSSPATGDEHYARCPWCDEVPLAQLCNGNS